jgi:hypothetical protein
VEGVLLHHPVVQLYLLYVGALLIVLVWDLLHDGPATRDDRKKTASGGVETGAAAGVESKAPSGALAAPSTNPSQHRATAVCNERRPVRE